MTTIEPTAELSASVRTFSAATEAVLIAITHAIDKVDITKAIELIRRLEKDLGLVAGVMEAAIKLEEADRAG